MSVNISGGHAPYKPLEWPILWGCQTPSTLSSPPPSSCSRGLRRLINVNVFSLLKPIRCTLSGHAQQNITLFRRTAAPSLPSLTPQQSHLSKSRGVWRLVETGLPDSTQLRPAWPILWYLTTRLQDTCSFELKCHWGILSAYRHLSLTSDFTLVCYKAENTGPWPWRTKTVS